MPYYLKTIDDFQELEKFASVLIIPCRFCPAASFAVSRGEPYFAFLRNFLQTAAYENYIDSMQSHLRQKGVTADVFKSHLPHQFVICMWTRRRRNHLMRRAMEYDALVVLGCEAAARTVSDSVKSASCKVFQGMRTEGIMSVQPSFHAPCNISLRLDSITAVLQQQEGTVPWGRL